MKATLTCGVLAVTPSARAGYAQPTNPKVKRRLWDRPDALAFKILPNPLTIHSATISVILARAPGDPTILSLVDALLMDPEHKDCLCSEAVKNFYLRPEYYRERGVRLAERPARLGVTK